jgi:hypothetical protein
MVGSNCEGVGSTWDDNNNNSKPGGSAATTLKPRKKKKKRKMRVGLPGVGGLATYIVYVPSVSVIP